MLKILFFSALGLMANLAIAAVNDDDAKAEGELSQMAGGGGLRSINEADYNKERARNNFPF